VLDLTPLLLHLPSSSSSLWLLETRCFPRSSPPKYSFPLSLPPQCRLLDAIPIDTKESASESARGTARVRAGVHRRRPPRPRPPPTTDRTSTSFLEMVSTERSSPLISVVTWGTMHSCVRATTRSVKSLPDGELTRLTHSLEPPNSTGPGGILHHCLPKSHNRISHPCPHTSRAMANTSPPQAMIADLKVDSERWEAERRTASGGRPMNGTSRDSSGFGRPSNTQPAPQYIGSKTQHQRDYYGTSTEAPPIQPSSGYPAASAAGNIHTPGAFDGGYQGQHQPQQGGYVQPSGAGGYGQQPPQGYPIHQEPPREYSFGANFPVDPRNASRVPVTQVGGQIPRADVYSPSGSTPNYPSQDNRNPYNYASQPPVSSSAQHYNQPTDYGYGRGAYNHQPNF